MFPLALSECARAAEIRGQVSKASAGLVEVTTDSQLLPRVGDKAEVYIELKVIKSTALVSAGSVSALNGTTIIFKSDNPKASIQPGQLVRITSENPIKRSEAASPQAHPPGDDGTTGLDPDDPNGPDSLGPWAQKITFDHLEVASGLSRDALLNRGVLLMLRPDCDARIEPATSGMVMPPGRKQLLMVAQNPTESHYAISFAEPVRKVAITRPGVINGSSMPKWKLTAMTNAGKALATTGEDTFGFDKNVRRFSVEANGIQKVDITVDNRWGTGTYATFSCLPIAEIEYVPQDAPRTPPAPALGPGTAPSADSAGVPEPPSISPPPLEDAPPEASAPPTPSDVPPFDDVPGAN
jgi:hypothetical protein